MSKHRDTALNVRFVFVHVCINYTRKGQFVNDENLYLVQEQKVLRLSDGR